MVGLSALLFAIAVVVGWHGMSEARNSLKTVYEDRAVPLLDLASFSTIMKDNYAEVLRGFQHDPQGQLHAAHDHPAGVHIEAVQKRKAELDALWAKYMATYLTEEEKVLAADFADKRKVWTDKLGVALAALEAGDYSPKVMAEFLKAGREEGTAAEQAMARLMQYQGQVAKSEFEGAEAEFRFNVTVYIVLFLAGVIGVLSQAFLTVSHIARSLREAEGAADTIASGDLTRPMPRAGEDEIGQLMAKLSVMRNTLHELIASISQNMKALAQSATELSGSATSSARTTEMQAEAASSMAASVEQLSVSIDQPTSR
jgi:methyl-accepting chemotaxis protein